MAFFGVQCVNLINIYGEQREYKLLLPILGLALKIKNSPDLVLRHAQVNAILDNYDVAEKELQLFLDTLRDPEGGISRDLPIAQSMIRFLAQFRESKNLFEQFWSNRKVRESGMEFYIGEVVVHKRYAYRGVIYGHDKVCEAEETWIQQMSVDDLPKGRRQPFYNVIVDCRDR